MRVSILDHCQRAFLLLAHRHSCPPVSALSGSSAHPVPPGRPKTNHNHCVLLGAHEPILDTHTTRAHITEHPRIAHGTVVGTRLLLLQRSSYSYLLLVHPVEFEIVMTSAPLDFLSHIPNACTHQRLR